MKNTLVVVTGLACFKAFRIQNTDLNRNPRLELVEEFTSTEAQGHLVDKVSDLAGRFPRGAARSAASGAMSDGERHNIELESRKRLVRQLADRLNTIARNPDVERCYLAASKEINRQLLERLEPDVKSKLLKNVPADLTKMNQTEILRYFSGPRLLA